MKKIISLLLSIVMIASAFFCVDLSALAANVNVTNRAEWLTELVETFDMTVESDQYPDNYFSDLTEDSEYYQDVLVATEFGLVNVEAGDPVDPDGKITREFAAQTLNFCLGFELNKGSSDYEYSFADYEDCLYPDDDQIAVNRGWFTLDENGNFCPDMEVTSSEITLMISDANSVLGKDEIDENYDSEYVFADYVVEVPNGTEVDLDENDTVQIKDCPVTISVGDTFVVYINDLPAIYVAESVDTQDNITTITTSEADTSSAVLDINMQEITTVDADQIEPVDGLEVEKEPSIQPFSNGKNTVNSVTLNGKVKVNGISVGLTAKISDIDLETKANMFANEYGAVVSFDAELSTDISANLVDVDIPLGTISILGVGKVTLSINVDIKGEASIVQKYKSSVGFSYSNDDGFRNISNFVKDDFSVVIQVSGSIGLKLSVSVTVLVLKAEIFGTIGLKVEAKIENHINTTPRICATVQAHMFAEAGYKVSIKAFSLEYEKSKTWNFMDEDNSPVRLYYHFEDGVKVNECTAGDDIKYLTPDDSAYGTIDGDYYKDQYISSLFTYTVRNGQVTITGLANGYEPTHLEIPSSINGYPVTKIGTDAFWNCDDLIYVAIPEGLTSIGDSAFDDCNGLESINIPDSVTNIGYRAFYLCNNLTNVSLGNGIKNIGNYAFANCSKLDINLPNSVTNIGEGAFYACEKLTSVVIPNEVKSIGNYAFYFCKGLITASIGVNVTSIGNFAFQYCDSLTNVTILGKANIGQGTFENCDSLTSVILSDGVTNIGDSAFRFCHSLRSITIPNSVKSIGAYAFSGSGIKTLAIPDSVTSIGNYAFCYCDSLSYVVLSNNLTKISDHMFDSCSNLKSITIPEGVKEIDDYAFNECYNLTRVTIPASVEVIGEYAFYTNTYPGLLDAFYSENKEDWDNISVGANNDNLLDATLRYNHNHKFIERNVPLTCTGAGYTEYKCSSCSTIMIGNYVAPKGHNLNLNGACVVCGYGENSNSCGDNATWSFNKDSGVLTINGTGDMYDYYIDTDTVNGLDTRPWKEYIDSITKVVVSDGITHIGSYAFAVNDLNYYDSEWGVYNGVDNNINSIILPKTITSIGENAFYYCVNLRNVYYEGAVNDWCNISFANEYSNPMQGAAYDYYYGYSNEGSDLYINNELLTDLIVPSGVSKINDYAFYNCASLLTVTLPAGVTTIGEKTFDYCYDLNNISIPSSVNNILSGAFLNCESLSNIYYGSNEASWKSIEIYEYNDDLLDSDIHFNHSHYYDSVQYVEPEAGNPGYTLYTCSSCGHSFKNNYKSANGEQIGVCGENAYWTFDSETGTITIGGTGDMYNSYFYNNYDGLRIDVRFWRNLQDLGVLDKGIKSVVVLDGITSIGDNAFNYCKLLNSITLPDGLTSIGDYALYNCDLSEIELPESINSIGISEFGYFTELQDIYYKGSKEQYDKIYVGEDNSHFSDAIVHFNTSIEHKNTYKFVESVPPTCTESGYDKYVCSCGCEKKVITSYAIGHDYQFSKEVEPTCTECGYKEYICSVCGDTMIENTYPLGHEFDDSGICNKCGMSEQYTGSCGNNTYWTYDTDTNTLIISGLGYMNNYSYDYENNEINNDNRPWKEFLTEIKTIIITDEVSDIGTAAFFGCTNLVNVTIGNDVYDIGAAAFGNCSSLTEIVIPDSVDYIETDAFINCSALENITISNEIDHIYGSAFDGCTGLTDVYYSGSEADWAEIYIDEYNDDLLNATIHYNSTGAHEHSYTAVVTPPTCTEEGYTTYTCTCGDSFVGDYVPATGHKWGTWSYNGDAEYNSSSDYKNGTQTRKCTVCGESETIEAPNTALLRRRGNSIALESSITLTTYITKDVVDYYDEVYAEFTRNGKTEKVYASDELLNSGSAQYYIFEYSGISPQAMIDDVEITFYGIKDGVKYWGDTYTYSITDYVKTTLAKPDSTDELKTMLVDLMYYGAACQTYQNYKTDQLMTDILTEEQKQYKSTYELELNNIKDTSYQTCENRLVRFGTTLRLNDAVEMAIALNMTDVSIEDLTFKVKVGTRELTYTYAENPENFEKGADGYWYFYFDGVYAHQMNEEVFITAYQGNEQVSYTLRYSIESYAAIVTDAKLKAVTDAMMYYGNSAKIYAG